MLPRVYTIMFWVSISLVVAAVVATAAFGLNLGVDFKGGAVMELSFTTRPSVDAVTTALGANAKDIEVSPAGTNEIILRTSEISEDQHQALLQQLTSAFPSSGLKEESFDSIGPAVGSSLEHRSLIAIIIVLLCVIIYIAFVFRKLGRTTSPWAMGLAAILALIHDVTIPVGVFAVLGKYFGIQISEVFVAAALTILGFSVSDTVVIFDRVRENIIRSGGKESFPAIVHKSVMQTLTRSLNTVFTVLLSLFAIYFFGGESIKYFALALIIGIFLGAYSSIFVASPLLVWLTQRRVKK